uniref:Nucleolar protein 14 n=1 Tax=Panagrellus redivivus TaxID=6233 RepID=A0A7E4VEQ0_PANRE
MGKNKKPRERKAKVEKTNPFELKYNVQRTTSAKGRRNVVAVGKPKASVAMEKRAKTIGVEVKRQGIVNAIRDGRVGERSKHLSEEAKASMRYVEARRAAPKRFKFNLEDNDAAGDEEDFTLTHKGESITKVKRYEKPEVDSDPELDSNVVALANFGGGNLGFKMTDEDGQRRQFSRKDLLHEVISKSKDAKMIKQMARDDLVTAAETLDEKFKLFKASGELAKLASLPVTKFPPVPENHCDDYDEIYNTLIFDTTRKAMPTLSEKEKAEREAAKLRELEAERQKRMESDSESDGGDEPKSKKKKKANKDGFNVVYDEEGNIKGDIDAMKIKAPTDDHIGADEEVDDFYADDSDAEGDEAEDDEAEDGVDEDSEVEAEDGESEDASDDDEEEVDDDDDEEAESEEEESAPVDAPLPAMKTRDPPAPTTSKTPTKGKLLEDTSVPFVFDMPKTYADFRNLYTEYFVDQWPTVTDRLIKCHHPSLAEGNKRRMGKLFRFGLRFYDNLAKSLAAAQLSPMIEVLRKFQALNIEASASVARSLLLHKRAQFKPAPKAIARPTATFDIIAFFAAIGELFPTSDRVHAVTTPTFVFALEVLRLSQINSVQSVGVTLLMARIVAKWIQESQKFVPELINAIRILLELSVETKPGDYLLDPFAYRHISRKNGVPNALVVKSKETLPEAVVDSAELFKPEPALSDAALKLHLLRSLFGLIDLTVAVYERLPLAFGAIFAPHLILLQRIDASNYPAELKSLLTAVTEKLQSKTTEFAPREDRQRKVIHKVKCIKMVDPVFENDFDATNPLRGQRRLDPEAETNKLRKMVRKEKRGAMKELRLDAKFLALEQQQRDSRIRNERKEKTNQILHSLQVQESDYKKRKLKKF